MNSTYENPLSEEDIGESGSEEEEYLKAVEEAPEEIISEGEGPVTILAQEKSN